MNVLPFEKQVRIVAALVEGNSIRSTERMLDIHRDTVMNVGLRIGEACGRLHDATMRNVNVTLLELDEAWSYVGCHQRFVKIGDPKGFGDAL